MAPKRKPIEEVKSKVINVRITESDYQAINDIIESRNKAKGSDISNVSINVSKIVREAIADSVSIL